MPGRSLGAGPARPGEPPAPTAKRSGIPGGSGRASRVVSELRRRPRAQVSDPPRALSLFQGPNASALERDPRSATAT